MAREVVRPRNRRQVGLLRRLRRFRGFLDRCEIDRARQLEQRHRRLERVRGFGRSVPRDQRGRFGVDPRTGLGQHQHRAGRRQRQFARGEGRRIRACRLIARAHHHQVVQRGFAQQRQRRRPARIDPVPRHVLIGEIGQRRLAQPRRLLAPDGYHRGKGGALEIEHAHRFIGDCVQQREMRIEPPRQTKHGVEPPGKGVIPGGIEQDRLHGSSPSLQDGQRADSPRDAASIAAVRRGSLIEINSRAFMDRETRARKA